MTRWTRTEPKSLTKADPSGLKVLIAGALDAIARVLPLLGDLTDSRQPGLGAVTSSGRKAAGQLLARERAARYPTRRADGSLIAVGQRGLVRSDMVVTMPGERPVPVNLSAVSVADEITTTLMHINRRIHRQLAAAGICHIHRPVDHPDHPGQVITETRRLVDVIAAPKLLLEVARTVEDLADRACTIALGPDRIQHTRPCPHCRRHSLVVHLDAGITRCEGTHRCKCGDSFCPCQRDRGHRHEWRQHAPTKDARKGWRGRKESYDGLIREQNLVDRETAADTTTIEGAPTMTTTDDITVTDVTVTKTWATATVVVDGTTVPQAEPHHHIELTLDHGYPSARFVCTAPEGSSCRLMPACYLTGGACIDQSEDGNHRDDCTENDRRLVDAGECNTALWIESCEAIEAGAGTIQVPVATEWNGDCFDWTFATDNTGGAQ